LPRYCCVCITCITNTILFGIQDFSCTIPAYVGQYQAPGSSSGCHFLSGILRTLVIPIGGIIILLGAWGIAELTGYWHSQIPADMFAKFYKMMAS